MRKTSNKGRKTNNDDSIDQSASNNSASIQMELELLALKAKNTELTNAHAKLLHENFEMGNEIISLRRMLLDVESRSNNLEEAFKKLSQDMQKCTPQLIDILNLFLQVTDSRKSNKSILSYTPKAKAITHTVKPHTVNGTVLNLNPTISLTRLNSIHAQIPNEEPSSSTHSVDYRNSLPSTSNNDDNGMENVDNGQLNVRLNNSETTLDDFVLRKSHLNPRASTLLAANTDESLQMEVENDVESEELLDTSQDHQLESRLSTINEESICSTSGSNRSNLGEIRIYLSRLPPELMPIRTSPNDTCSSTEANLNDTCLNIETTVIENQEIQGSQRLRANIMVFSPCTNSTVMNGDNLSDDELDSMCLGERLRTSGVPSVSAIQSTEVTPSSGNIDEDEGLPTSNPLAWLPTPSMSAMGDIDRSNYSRLDILTERSERKLSPRPSMTSPRRNTRSKRRRARTTPQDEASPRTSREGLSSKSRVSCFVSRQRGGSGDKGERVLTPIIVLERLENSSLGHRITRSSPINQEKDDPKENKKVPNKQEPKSSQSRSRSPKRSAKRKKVDEANSLHTKIREIQMRLSSYVPESSSSVAVSPENSAKRPSRAAKPKDLKDASLKSKLRRMI